MLTFPHDVVGGAATPQSRAYYLVVLRDVVCLAYCMNAVFLLRRTSSRRPQRAERRTKVSKHAASFAASVVVVAYFHLGSYDRSQPGLPEPEAGLLQSSGSRRLSGLAVEEERRQGILLPKMEEVLVCPEGQLSVLVHQ